jgi:hypothetical protein
VPSEWPRREGITVKVGMSPGERQRRVAALEKLAQLQERMAAQGMDEVMVDLERFYRLALDWCRANDIPNPEQYFIDPQSQQAQKARKSKNESAMRDKQAQTAFLQQAVQLEQLRTALGKYQTDVETQFKYWAETIRAEIEEAKIVGSATTELIKAKSQPKLVSTTGSKDDAKSNGAGGRRPAAAKE